MDARETAYLAELKKHHFQMALDPLGAVVVSSALAVLQATMNHNPVAIVAELVQMREAVHSLGPADCGSVENAIAAAARAERLERELGEWLIGVIATGQRAAAAVPDA